MGKEELGTKRVDPETGRKFYDLNKDPIVSPYTGKSYPRSFFETDVKIVEDDEDPVAEELDVEEDLEVVSLEEADDDADPAVGSPDVDEADDDVIELDDDDADDTFLADDEEEEDEDVTGIIRVGKDEEDL